MNVFGSGDDMIKVFLGLFKIFSQTTSHFPGLLDDTDDWDDSNVYANLKSSVGPHNSDNDSDDLDNLDYSDISA